MSRLASGLVVNLRVINLTGNAIKFTKVGKVDLVDQLVDADSDDAKLKVDVVDTGIGVTEKQIGSLFQAFVQADTSTTRRFGGTGLGLTISKRLIAFILRKAGGEMCVVENGQLAVDAALKARDERKPFDVILMDMQMPVLDGYDATRKLREAGYLSPIITLTAHAMSGDRKKCIDAGCDEHTTKPIESC